MSVDFGRIKKYSKASNDIDEKLEYLNKEFKKTGLCEIAANSTPGIYVRTEEEPNPAHTTFSNASFNGKPFGMTSLSGKSIGGSTNASGHSISPDGLRVAKTYQGIANGFEARPPGFQRTPTHRKVGSFLWYWNGTHYRWLEWKYDNQYEGDGGEGAQWKQGMFPYLDPIIGDASFDPNLLAAIRAAGGGGAAFPDPDDITPPINLILFQNKLEHPDFLPVNIPDLSTQGFNYLKKRAKELAKKYNRKYQGANDPFWDDFVNSFPDIPAGDEDPFTRKGTGMDDRWIGPPVDKVDASGAGSNNQEPYDPFANEAKPNLGAKPGDQIAMFGGKPKPPTKKSDFKGIKKNTAIKNATMSVNGMGMSPAAFEKKYGISPKDFLNLPENKISHKKYIEEGVKLGHFEPEVLNVDINKLRKGILPEFPKNPPPEMIDGYAANSRLAPKKLELPPFIKVTKKDIAQNHLLTDKEISDFMNDIDMINDYIKKNPAELKYAMIRYPKDDPRLAQLNWQMDQKLGASEEYMETHFPENQKLFDKIKKKIKNTIAQTDPKNFKGVKLPKFDKTNLEEFKKKKEVYSRYFKKPVKIKKLFRK